MPHYPRVLLAAIAAACFGVSSPAVAQYMDQLAQCDKPNASCEAGFPSQVRSTTDAILGVPFETYMDYDITAGNVDVCEVQFYVQFDSNAVAFAGARRLGSHFNEVVGCETGSQAPSPLCPACDSWVYCSWFDAFGGDVEPSISAELALSWEPQRTGEVGSYADIWGAWGRSEAGVCNYDLTLGDWGYHYTYPSVLTEVVPAPEPGGGMMLAAGSALLVVLTRRREHRR